MPPGHQVQHVHTGAGHARRLARFAGQLDAADGEETAVRFGVFQLDESGVEVDLRGECGDGDER